MGVYRHIQKLKHELVEIINSNFNFNMIFFNFKFESIEMRYTRNARTLRLVSEKY